ncbi:MAG: chorismate synthase [Candidatus Eisenbacteria sp.]|nr:chorismate synthase [Candidatus Eisenbacteria bacterium]
MALRFLTAGDSHGDSLTGIIEGLPAGIPVSLRKIRRELRRRSQSFGRGSRQEIETDQVEILGGLWKGKTTGAPLAIRIPNRGRKVSGKRGGALSTVPRPGHADLAGCLKYGLDEVPPISERASARSTAMRVAIGAVARMALERFSVEIISHVRSIGGIAAEPGPLSVDGIRRRVARSPVRCVDPGVGRRMADAIRSAQEEGHSLGGSVEVVASGIPPGVGSHVAWDRKLDARLAGALMSIQSVKAVEIGEGLDTHRRFGVDAQDAIVLDGGRLARPTNFAGGIEGGISNGEDITVRVYAKPIPTAKKCLPTVNLRTLKPRPSPYVRSDVCVIPALGVIAESVVAWELLCAVMEKFGGDHMDETERNLRSYLASLEERTRP